MIKFDHVILKELQISILHLFGGVLNGFLHIFRAFFRKSRANIFDSLTNSTSWNLDANAHRRHDPTWQRFAHGGRRSRRCCWPGA